MTNYRHLLGAFVALGVFVGLMPVNTLAQAEETSTVEMPASSQIVREKISSTEVSGDFVVGPGRIELNIEPGTAKTFELTITNRLGVEKEFSLLLEDIAGSDNPEQAVVLLGDDVGPNSLRDFILLPASTITIAHGERVRIPITVSLPQNAGPVGRYGSVVVSVTSDPDPSNVGASSAIVSRISTLLFVTTPGTIDRESSLEKFAVVGDETWLKRGPVDFGILFKNSGNTHLNPYGEIRIYNLLNQEVGRLEVSPWYVLPNAVRLREMTWEKEPLFGRYTAVLSLYNGYENTPTTATYTFYVASWWSLGLFGVLVLGLVWLLGRRKNRYAGDKS